MNVIERFVSETISGPLGIDIREAAAIFENYSIGFHGFNQDDMRYQERDLSVIAWSLSQALGIYAPGLPSLLSYPDFPLADDRRTLMDSIASIQRRLYGRITFYLKIDRIYNGSTGIHPIQYLETVLNVYTKVEDRYTRLCQETGVDVQHTYRPMVLLSRKWEGHIERDTRLIQTVILPMVDDARTIEFAKTVGRCLDFAMRHSVALSIEWLDYLAHDFATTFYNKDPRMICDILMTKGFARDKYGRFLVLSSDHGRLVLTDFSDANPPNTDGIR